MGIVRSLIATRECAVKFTQVTDKVSAQPCSASCTPRPHTNATPQLLQGQIRWKPDLGDGDDDAAGVRRMFAQWSKRFLATGDLMKRLDVGEGSYGREIEEDYDVAFACGRLQEVRILVDTDH